MLKNTCERLHVWEEEHLWEASDWNEYQENNLSIGFQLIEKAVLHFLLICWMEYAKNALRNVKGKS